MTSMPANTFNNPDEPDGQGPGGPSGQPSDYLHGTGGGAGRPPGESEERRRRPILIGLLLPAVLLIVALFFAAPFLANSAPVFQPVANLTLDTLHQLGLGDLSDSIYGRRLGRPEVSLVPEMCGMPCDDAVAAGSCGEGLWCVSGVCTNDELCYPGQRGQPLGDGSCNTFCDPGVANSCDPGLDCVQEPDGYYVCWGGTDQRGATCGGDVPTGRGTCNRPCTPTAGANTCDPGLSCQQEPDGGYVCWGGTDSQGRTCGEPPTPPGAGTCSSFCDPADENSCDPGLSCVREPDGYNVCWYGTDSEGNTCGAPERPTGDGTCNEFCDPQAPNCDPGLSCVREPDGYFVCWGGADRTGEVCGQDTPGGGACNSPCSPNATFNSCDPGLSCQQEPDGYFVCWGGTDTQGQNCGDPPNPVSGDGDCNDACDPSAANPCDPGLDYVREPDGEFVCWYGTDSTGYACGPDNPPNPGGCNTSCSPTAAANTCDPGLSCQQEPDGEYICWGGTDEAGQTCGQPQTPPQTGGTCGDPCRVDQRCVAHTPDGICQVYCRDDNQDGQCEGYTCVDANADGNCDAVNATCGPDTPMYCLTSVAPQGTCAADYTCQPEPDGGNVCWAATCFGQAGGGEQPPQEPPPGGDPCANNGGLQWSGEVCVCSGVVDQVIVCADGTKFDTLTNTSCTPDPAACPVTGEEPTGQPGGQGACYCYCDPKYIAACIQICRDSTGAVCNP